MTGFLLDTNVLRETGPGGHKNVQAWLSTVGDADLFVSALSVYEIQRGVILLARRDPEKATRRQVALDALRAAYRGRIVPVDEVVATEWGQLVGEKDKHRDDMALAATARVHGLVLATRNVADFRGRGVRVLDPFKARPAVVTV